MSVVFTMRTVYNFFCFFVLFSSVCVHFFIYLFDRLINVVKCKLGLMDAVVGVCYNKPYNLK